MPGGSARAFRPPLESLFPQITITAIRIPKELFSAAAAGIRGVFSRVVSPCRAGKSLPGVTLRRGHCQSSSDSARFRRHISSKRKRVRHLRPDTLAGAACLYSCGLPPSWRSPTKRLCSFSRLSACSPRARAWRAHSRPTSPTSRPCGLLGLDVDRPGCATRYDRLRDRTIPTERGRLWRPVSTFHRG